MEWLSQNWVFLLIAIAFVAMHLFGHGSHGGHSHGGRTPQRRDAEGPSGGHRH